MNKKLYYAGLATIILSIIALEMFIFKDIDYVSSQVRTVFYVVALLTFAITNQSDDNTKNKKEEDEEEDEDVEEEDEEEDEDVEEEDETKCDKCGKVFAEDEEYCECEICEENLCLKCAVDLGGSYYCKNCIDEAYPREKQIEVKEVIKTIEVPKEVIKVVNINEPIL